MKKPNAFFDYLRIIFSFSYWIMTKRYCKSWDATLNQLMQEYTFEALNDGGYRVTLGKYTIWIENYPYSSFYPYMPGYPKVRPKRLTILRARRKLMSDLFSKDPESKA